MDKILRPRREHDYPDRLIDCEEALEPVLQSMMALAREHGWGPNETRKALFRLIAADRRTASENAKTETAMALMRAATRARR